MIQTKYYIFIGIIILLIVLYYFYDDISQVKKLFIPTYQKTMALEARLLEIEKRTLELASNKKKLESKNDSPALSITYQSDMVKNGNLSVKYADLSDTEAKKLLKYMEQNKSKQQELLNQSQVIPSNIQQLQHQTHIVPQEIPSRQIQLQPQEIPSHQIQLQPQNSKRTNIPNWHVVNNDIFTNNESLNEDNDIFNVKIDGLINKNPLEMIDLENKSDTAEYQKILKGLTTSVKNMTPEDTYNDDIELDQDIIKSISESIQFADLPSDNTISDIPIIKSKNKKNQQKNNKSSKNIKNKTKSKILKK